MNDLRIEASIRSDESSMDSITLSISNYRSETVSVQLVHPLPDSVTESDIDVTDAESLESWAFESQRLSFEQTVEWGDTVTTDYSFGAVSESQLAKMFEYTEVILRTTDGEQIDRATGVSVEFDGRESDEQRRYSSSETQSEEPSGESKTGDTTERSVTESALSDETQQTSEDADGLDVESDFESEDSAEDTGGSDTSDEPTVVREDERVDTPTPADAGLSRTIAVAGAKGGVGKTTTSLNLGTAFATAGVSTVVVEFDLAMANFVDFIETDVDIESDTTFHDVLTGTVPVEDALYQLDSGLVLLPSATSLEGYSRTNLDRLPDVMETLEDQFDTVLLDTPAGLSQETIRPIEMADDVILVSTPRVSSVRNTKNTLEVAARVDTTVRGLVLTKSGTGSSPGAHRIAEFLDVELLGYVPEDDAIPHSQDSGLPVVEYAPSSSAATAYRDIASTLLDADTSARSSSDDSERGVDSIDSDTAQTAVPSDGEDPSGPLDDPQIPLDAGLTEDQESEVQEGEDNTETDSDSAETTTETAVEDEATESAKQRDENETKRDTEATSDTGETAAAETDQPESKSLGQKIKSIFM